jgi:hypothetical protein
MEKNIPDEILFVTDSLTVDSSEKVKRKLMDLLNELINNDFEALIQLLYRIDVNEKKIRDLLNENDSKDAAPVIAELIIERQLQKIESRKNYRSKNDNSSEERWVTI